MRSQPRYLFRWREIPGSVWMLGLVSMFMDISSEMIHALLPLYLVTVLGASALTVGFIEGIAEATASITKIFSGALSDWFRATERYSLQLHEISQKEYLSMKREEYRRQQAGGE
jgi:hypothetical protein